MEMKFNFQQHVRIKLININRKSIFFTCDIDYREFECTYMAALIFSQHADRLTNYRTDQQLLHSFIVQSTLLWVPQNIWRE